MLTTLEQLETIYGQPLERAVRKEIPFLNPDYQAMVRASPLVILSTSSRRFLDSMGVAPSQAAVSRRARLTSVAQTSAP